MNPLRPIWRTWLASRGWRVEDNTPVEHDKFVIVAAPHTTNWDFPYTMAVAAQLDMSFYWVGKHTLFRGPMGTFMRSMGGIPVDRTKRSDFTSQIVKFIEAHDGRMSVALAPEGTRGKSECWKSGFYHIAKAANVPILLGFLDFENKVGGIGKMIWPLGSETEVMDEIRDFYRASMAHHPQLFVEPCLRSESKPAPEPAPTMLPEAAIEPLISDFSA